MKNVLVEAVRIAKQHVVSLLSGNDDLAQRKAELEKLTKKDLVDLILGTERFTETKIEDLVKLVLEDPNCAWLDYETIANIVKEQVPSAKTSNKSIASYASKYPAAKGWVVVPRKSAAERMAAMMSLVKIN
jgi:hypothetical protein